MQCPIMCPPATGVEMREYAMNEEEVMRSLNAVAAAKKQVERVGLDRCVLKLSWCLFQ